MALDLALVLALVLGSDSNVQVLQEEVTCRFEVVLVSSLSVLSSAAWRHQQVLYLSVFHNHLHHQCLVAVRVSTQAGVGEIHDALIWHVAGVGVGELKVADPSV